MNRKHQTGRDVFPDYPVHYSIADLLANKDLEMEMAIRLIIDSFSINTPEDNFTESNQVSQKLVR